MSEPTLAELLAYPTRVEDVTAKSMLRYLLVQAQVLQARVADEAAGYGRIKSAGEYAMAFAATHLLRDLIADDPNFQGANEAARELWEAWDDGATMGECLWDWLTAEGLAPEQIQLAYEAARSADEHV